jgi:hypothetical protein
MAIRNILRGGGSTGGFSSTSTGIGANRGLAGSDVFGSKPATPNLQQSQLDAILANLGNFGDIANLSGRTNQFNQGEVLEQLRRAVPGYDAITAQQSANILDMLNGRLPPEVLRALQEQSAAYGVSSGTLGSGFQANQGLRNLGLNALEYMNQGAQLANQTLANRSSIATSPILNPATSFISPEAQTQRDLYASLVASAPDPVARGRYEEALAREMAELARAAGIVPPAGTTGVPGVRPSTPGKGTTDTGTGPGWNAVTSTAESPFAPGGPRYRPPPPQQSQSGLAVTVVPNFSGPSFTPSVAQYQPPYATPPATSTAPFSFGGASLSPMFDMGTGFTQSPIDYGPGIQDFNYGAPAQAATPFDFNFGEIDYSPPSSQSVDDVMNFFLGPNPFE